MSIEGLTLTKRERELQSDVCELEWPEDDGEKYAIMKLIRDFMIETETNQARTCAIIGWPSSNLSRRLATFRRSDAGEWESAGQEGGKNNAIDKARRIAKANPEAFLEDAPTARKLAGAVVDSPSAMKIVGEALEPAPLVGKVEHVARKQVEAQAPGEMLLLEFYGWYVRGKKLLGIAQDAGKLNKAGREDLEETAELVRTLVDLVVTAGTSGNWDEELEALLDEEV